MRRLRALNKSGAGEHAGVSMERETEEVGGRSSGGNAAVVRAASLPPCFAVNAAVAVGAAAVAASHTSLAPGEETPSLGTEFGEAVIKRGGRAERRLSGRKVAGGGGKPKNKTRVSPLK